MSFQAYINNITTKTGKTPDQIREEALIHGVITENMKATVFTDWLNKVLLNSDCGGILLGPYW